ncbi:hypothetical protein ACFSSE_01515 [Pedobacter alpinus]|uniref:Uncharacterized protein n=1 Tax=Pedobacter alpinus TaxID=1590643 RepID=A0ABW5TQI5_9SPHI
MYHFINDFNFGVNVFFYQKIENKVAYNGCTYQRYARIIPIMLEIKVNRSYGNTNRKGINENKGT